MRVLVVNGSPKGERSDTMKVTRAFLEGMQIKDYEVIDTMKQRVNPCLGCYSCWWKTPGNCVQKDGMEEVLNQIQAADLVIWSFPLYCYGMPSNLKAYMDRLLPLSTPVQHTDENGQTYHPARQQEHEIKMILISGCGFPDREGNYDGLIFSMNKMFQLDAKIICVEQPMLSIEEAAPVAERYIECAKRAGREYAAEGQISNNTQDELDRPMLDPKVYRKMCSGE